MINVVICEDDKNQREIINRYIIDIIKNNNYKANVALSTDKPSEVIEYSKTHLKDINAYFMDIDLKLDIDGILLAHKIRKMDLKCYFIFITGHSELFMRTFKYKVRALDYILKEDFTNLKSRLKECMDVIYREYLKNEGLKNVENRDIVIVKCGHMYYKIPSKQIIFLETAGYGHKILMHTNRGQIEFYGKLTEFMNKLNQNFYRCHKSYVINLQYIKEINKDKQYIETTNGERCFFSKRYERELFKKWYSLK